MKEEGGAASLDALNAALLFNLGATVGGRVLATAIVSLLLCPGTPANVAFTSAALARAGFFFSSGLIPSLREAARVILGAIVGAAVDATVIVSERLCPGTFAKVCARRSFVGGARFFSSMGIPARSAAAFDMRGTISGAAWVGGRVRALKPGFLVPLADPPACEEVVYSDSPPPFLNCSRTEEDTDRIDPTGISCPTSGRSVVGKGGEEAKMAWIWISAVCASGEPMTPF